MRTIKWFNIKLLEEKTNDIIQTLLKNRKIVHDPECLESFFNPSISDLHDPFLFDWMEKSVKRILEARDKEERVIVFWDYDVDGVSATAMLVEFFNEIGIQVSYRIPHRVKDWYWLKNYFMDDLAQKNTKLLVTVDCGTRDIDVISYAKSLWMDVIITDHHFVPTIIPDWIISLINPKLENCKYPNKNLSGSGVAFKLLQALAFRLFDEKKYNKIIENYIDFAMLGTVADCMQLVWENRVITYLWLKRLKNSSSAWLKKLIEWHNGDWLDSNLISYKIWPKLNAAWRMDSPYKALKVLLASEQNLDEIMEELEDLNTKRKASTEIFLKKAMEEIEEENNIIFYDSTEIEHGIIWLIAWRLSEAFNKIAIVLKDEWDKLVASSRAPEYISIIEILEEFKEMFIVFWGHDQAAGFSISKENFPLFKEKIEKRVSSLVYKVDKTKWLEIDASINLSQINFELLSKIEQFRPFWIWNPKPLFLLKNFIFSGIEYLGKEQKHLKFITNNKEIDIKAFGFWDYYKELYNKETISLIFEIERNIWNGRESISLNVVDIITD